MRLSYLRYTIVFTLFLRISAFGQLPYEWPIVDTELSKRFDTVETIIHSKWTGGNYCTNFAGSLLTASTNRGYYLFNPNPPGGLDTTWQNILLGQVDTMLLMMDSLGYTALDMDISYPTLVNTFPNNQLYLNFQKKVFAMARSMGFKTIVNCHASVLEAAQSNLLHDVDSFYFEPNGVPDTLSSQRFLTTKVQMMQTIIDSLAPDYMTVMMEPNTDNANLYYLLNFSADTCLYYVNYFLSNLDKKNTLLGAGAGTWNNISYFADFATTNIDYMDYHVYPVAGTCLNPMIFMVDSIAQANNKKIIIGECWCHKTSDSEWVYNTDLDFWRDTFYIRDDFNYFEHTDTQFTQIMINLSQQAHIELVDFFAVEYEFGYLGWNAGYASLPGSAINAIDDSINYSNMYQMRLGPLGVFTKNAIAQINCSQETAILMPETDIGMEIYPNPASAQLRVNFDGAVQNIEIFNVIGQKVQEIKVNNCTGTQLIDISSLSAGLYFARVLAPPVYAVQKFIKE